VRVLLGNFEKNPSETCTKILFCGHGLRNFFSPKEVTSLRVHSFGMIWIRISDSRSLGSWCIKGTNESTLVMDSSVPLMNYDPSDLRSPILIQIISKECTLKQHIISCNFVSAQDPARYYESSSCGPFEAKHPKQYQNCFFNC